MIADDMSKYLAVLLLYYEEEVEGEAYFRQLAAQFADPDHKHKLVLLAEVERHAAEGIYPLIAKYDLAPRSMGSLVMSGRAEAREAGSDWNELLAEMNRTYPGYLDSFLQLEAMGLAGDRRLLSFLTEHEVAALEFLALESENPQASTEPLRTYLATDPELWQAKAV